jgi:hypothetical protein
MLKIALLTAQLTVPAQQEVAPQPPPPPSLTPPPQTYIDTQGRTVTVSPRPGGGLITTDSQGRRTIGTEDGMLTNCRASLNAKSYSCNRRWSRTCPLDGPAGVIVRHA